ncbi:two-component system response regulator [candidate division KSB1 bacterium]|nr:MAG: two-component system response regulator [candidate division KSB1 bacterium]
MNSKVILVADDEPPILRSLSFVLKKEGYQVVEARDGTQVVELLQKGVQPDLVFLDVMMPKMDGFQVCKWMRSNPQWKNVHIIFLTAKGQNSDRQKGLILGGNEYITKPFSPSKLIQRVREIFS